MAAHVAHPLMLVTLTVDDLRALVREQVDAALAERAPEKQPQKLLVSGAEMAAMIDVSRTTLHRLRLEGCPAVPVCDTFKFVPGEVVAWLRERK